MAAYCSFRLLQRCAERVNIADTEGFQYYGWKLGLEGPDQTGLFFLLDEKAPNIAHYSVKHLVALQMLLGKCTTRP